LHAEARPLHKVAKAVSISCVRMRSDDRRDAQPEAAAVAGHFEKSACLFVQASGLP
jgi:hypothetical protein